MARQRCTVSPRCRGIALIAVLWVCALIAVLAAGFAYTLRSEAKLDASMVDRIRAATAAEAGVQRLLAMLSRARQGSQNNAPRQSYVLHFNSMTVRVDLLSEAGKIDLNAAPKALIQSLLGRAALMLDNLSTSQAQALADAILDWRDADSRVRDQGAEKPAYQALGLPGPRNQPFLSVSELRQVLGMTRQAYNFIAPQVSVSSQRSRIDPRAASRQTLLAVPGLEETVVDRYLAARLHGDARAQGVKLLTSRRYLLVPDVTRTYSIIARARTRSGVMAVRRAIVRLNDKADAPITILDWSRFSVGAGSVEQNNPMEKDT